MEMLVRPVQLSNALLPIDVTVLGIDIFLNPVHQKKAPFPILTKFLLRVTVSNPVHAKAYLPILVNEFGNSILLKLVSAKARLSILLTLLGIIILVSEPHSNNTP